MAELNRCEAALYFRRRADRLLKKVADSLGRLNYPASHDELFDLASQHTVEPCLFFFSYYYFLDTNVGGFLFFYWLLHFGDKWIVNDLAPSFAVCRSEISHHLLE